MPLLVQCSNRSVLPRGSAALVALYFNQHRQHSSRGFCPLLCFFRPDDPRIRVAKIRHSINISERQHILHQCDFDQSHTRTIKLWLYDGPSGFERNSAITLRHNFAGAVLQLLP